MSIEKHSEQVQSLAGKISEAIEDIPEKDVATALARELMGTLVGIESRLSTVRSLFGQRCYIDDQLLPGVKYRKTDDECELSFDEADKVSSNKLRWGITKSRDDQQGIKHWLEIEQTRNTYRETAEMIESVAAGGSRLIAVYSYIRTGDGWKLVNQQQMYGTERPYLETGLNGHPVEPMGHTNHPRNRFTEHAAMMTAILLGIEKNVALAKMQKDTPLSTREQMLIAVYPNDTSKPLSPVFEDDRDLVVLDAALPMNPHYDVGRIKGRQLLAMSEQRNLTEAELKGKMLDEKQTAIRLAAQKYINYVFDNLDALQLAALEGEHPVYNGNGICDTVHALTPAGFKIDLIRLIEKDETNLDPEKDYSSYGLTVELPGVNGFRVQVKTNDRFGLQLADLEDYSSPTKKASQDKLHDAQGLDDIQVALEMLFDSTGS